MRAEFLKELLKIIILLKNRSLALGCGLDGVPKLRRPAQRFQVESRENVRQDFLTL